MKEATVSSFFKLILSSAGVSLGTNDVVVPALSRVIDLPVLSVQVTLFGAAAFGAGLSLFFTDPIESRRMLLGQVLGATVFGVCLGVLCADALELNWAKKNLGMFVMMSAAATRWFLPSIIDRIKKLISEAQIPFLRKKGSEPDDR